MDPFVTDSTSILWRLEKVGHVSSSNDLVVRRARDGEKEGLVIWAQSQSKGRGRLGRQWISPPSIGLYFSVLLRPPTHIMHVAALSLVAAVAMAEGLIQSSGIPVELKWPNDLRIAGKKIGGILLEYESHGNQRPGIILGVGINLKSPPGGYPSEFCENATSMEAAGCQVTDEREIIQALLLHLANWYADFLGSGFEHARQRWEALCDGIDMHTSVRVTGDQIEGTMKGIDEMGRLIIEDREGKVHSIDTGEVI